VRTVSDRPWKWPDRQPYTLGLVIDRVPGQARTAIGWAVMGQKQPATISEGSASAISIDDAVNVAVLNFLQMKARYPNADGSPHIVQLYRYTKRSWPRSVAAAEGGTHANHERKLKAVAAALETEGAVVRFKTV